MTATDALAAAKRAADGLKYEALRVRNQDLETEIRRERERSKGVEETLRLQRCRGRSMRAALTDALSAARSELALVRGGVQPVPGLMSDGTLAVAASLELEEARRSADEWAGELVVERHRSADLRGALEQALVELHLWRTREWSDAARVAEGDGPEDAFWDDLLAPFDVPEEDDYALPDDRLADMLGRMRPRHVREAEALLRMRESEGLSGAGGLGAATMALTEAERPGYIAAATAKELETVLSERAAMGQWLGSEPVDPSLLAATMVRLRPMHELEASRILQYRVIIAERHSGLPVVGGPSYPPAADLQPGDVQAKKRRRSGRGGASGQADELMTGPGGGLRRSTRLSTQQNPTQVEA
jgi:hypothetical protein